MCYNKGTAIDWNSYQEELIGWICSFYRGSYFILVYEQLSLLHTNSYENKTKPKTRRVIYNKDFNETVFSWNDSVHNLLYVLSLKTHRYGVSNVSFAWDHFYTHKNYQELQVIHSIGAQTKPIYSNIENRIQFFQDDPLIKHEFR